MTDNYTWTYVNDDGQELTTLPDEATAGTFPSQAEAEAWLGEVWAELAAAGISGVTLRAGDDVVYGPMSLHAEG